VLDNERFRNLVFPAHAGMSRPTWIKRVIFIGFPRASGDEPIADVFLPVDGVFSPLARGFRGAVSGSGAVPA